MSTDLAVPQPAAQSTGELMAIIARAASDTAVDVEKMERLMALKERMDAQERERVFAEALARIQSDAPRVTKHGRTDKSRYALLEDIDAAIRPRMAEEGFSLSFDTETVDGKLLLVGKLWHKAGHSEEKRLLLGVDTGPGRNPVQAVGSTVSYGRRFLTKMFFNIIEVDEDDDGIQGARAQKISVEQARWIGELLAEVPGKDQQKFLAWLRVAKVTDITEKDYGRAEKFLVKKRDERTKAK